LSRADCFGRRIGLGIPVVDSHAHLQGTSAAMVFAPALAALGILIVTTQVPKGIEKEAD